MVTFEKKMIEYINPQINLNGMTANEHIRLRMEFRKKLMDAMKVLAELRPHGRDYISEPDRYKNDLDIYYARFRALDHLYNVVEQEAFKIQEQAE